MRTFTGVILVKGEGGRYESFVHRPDRGIVLVPGSDRTFRVPHDLAHVVTERELAMPDGVFGSVLAGALFDNMRLVTGRRHDARRQSDSVLRRNSRSYALGAAELLAGVVHHAVETGVHGNLDRKARADWGIIRQDPYPYTADQLRSAVNVLTELGARWRALSTGGELNLPWRFMPPKTARR